MVVLLGLGSIQLAIAQQPTAMQEELTGIELARQVFDRDRGVTLRSTAQMILVNKKNKKHVRQMSTLRRTIQGFERQLIRFHSPADIDGTGFLTIETQGYKTEQFLYLPALRRTRRIVTSQKSNRFVNSDFTYEDMERHPVEDYEYKLNEEKTVFNINCYELESRPKKGVVSQYGLTVSLIGKDTLVPVFVRYFDKKGKHVKTYKVLKLELKDMIWTETVVVMEDLKRRHKTYMKLDSVAYNSDISINKISKDALEAY